MNREQFHCLEYGKLKRHEKGKISCHGNCIVGGKICGNLRIKHVRSIDWALRR